MVLMEPRQQMLSASPAPSSTPPPAHPDPRHLSLESYWREVQSLEEEEEEEEDEEDEEDEVELKEAWLKGAGLSSLLTGAPCCSEEEALLSTLSRRQAATVRTRLDNYTQTLRGTNRQPVRDVRDIFTQVPGGNSAEPSGPSRFHTKTKTIRRNSHTVRPTLPLFVVEEPVPEKVPENLPENLPSQEVPPTPSPPHTHLPQVHWLLRAAPYSEGVSEHKRGGACADCLHFLSGDVHKLQCVPVSLSQGLTCADDLSSCDLTRLSFISHIELSTFLPALGVQMKRSRQPRRRARDSGVFGVSLISLLENDRKKHPEIKVPIVFHKLLAVLQQDGVHTEGILRVSGSVARLKHLRRELDRCCETFDWSEVRQVDASGLLKLFIRELPEPLLTHTHLHTFHCLQEISSELHQIQALQLLMLLLPESHRDTLRELLLFLRQVVSHQDHNRMSVWNVAMVMAPNLFISSHHGNKTSVLKQREQMEVAVGGANLLRLMISYQDFLWTVPAFLLSQVRQMNQVSHQKQLNLNRAKQSLLKKWTHRNLQDQVAELSEGVIRVHAPRHSKVSMAIQLNEVMTARDITSRFQCEDSLVQHLYEVGGNICERRLHPDCVLLDVYRVNPGCDWLLKP